MTKMRISTRVSQLVTVRDKGRCTICGLPVEAGGGNRHHRLPGKMGGRKGDVRWDCAANVVRCHPTCHEYVERNRLTSYISGWLVEENGDPAEVPFLYARVGWVLLTRQGGFIQCPAPSRRDMGDRFVEAVTYDPSSFTAGTEAPGGVAHPSPPGASLLSPPSSGGTLEESEAPFEWRVPSQRR